MPGYSFRDNPKSHKLRVNSSGKLTAAKRRSLPKKDFAVPAKAPKSGSYPIPDKSHARNALARASGKAVESKVRAAVKRKFPGIGKKKS